MFGFSKIQHLQQSRTSNISKSLKIHLFIEKMTILYTNITTSSYIDVGINILNFAQGSLIIFPNLFLALFIICSQKFRQQKEYIIFLGTMLYDILYGVSLIALGVYRFNLLWSEKCRCSNLCARTIGDRQLDHSEFARPSRSD